VAIRTGISIIAGSTAVFALSYVLANWRSRGRGPGRGSMKAAENTSPLPVTDLAATLNLPKHVQARTNTPLPVPVHVPAVESERHQRLQEFDGGVSARPAEQWHDSREAYDAANPEDLGAEFLARAVQVPLEEDEERSELDLNGLHVEDEFGEAGTPSEILRSERQLDLELDDLSAELTPEELAADDRALDIEVETSDEFDEEVETERPDHARDDAWYQSIQDLGPPRGRYG
jgi:hypothetical protein